jgi:hypothetical protein
MRPYSLLTFRRTGVPSAKISSLYGMLGALDGRVPSAFGPSASKPGRVGRNGEHLERDAHFEICRAMTVASPVYPAKQEIGVLALHRRQHRGKSLVPVG